MSADEQPVFAFGRNWQDFLAVVDERRLLAAQEALARLLPELLAWPKPTPPRLLDIGCGSGLHAVVAARFGAVVTAVDVDVDSVAATTDLVTRLGLADRVDVRRASILDSAMMNDGRFDVVYSWGVLHHTGAVWTAIDHAARLVYPASTSRLALALYRPTRADRFWVWEKRRYTRGGALTRWLLEAGIGTAWDGMRLAKGVTPWAYRADYWQRRGMSYHHDLRDWLGGYPYEPVARDLLVTQLEAKGFSLVREFCSSPGRVPVGVGGSGCDEFVFHVVTPAGRHGGGHSESSG